MRVEESEHEDSNGPIRTFRRLYIPDAVLTVVAVVLAAGGSHFIDWAEYMGGLRGLGVGRSFPLALRMRPLMALAARISCDLPGGVSFSHEGHRTGGSGLNEFRRPIKPGVYVFAGG